MALERRRTRIPAPPSSRQLVAWGGGFAPGYSGPRPAGGYGMTTNLGTPTGGFTGPVGVAGPTGLPTSFGDIPSWVLGLGANAIQQWIQNQLNPSGGSGSGSLPAEGSGGCPQGYEFNPSSGQCEEQGVGGVIRRTLPGGATGTTQFGAAVMGAFGIPALQPAVVGQRTNDRGETNPILKCPSGAVLGKDNLCYQKSSIPRKFRKWRPAPKPPMSASDAKALRRIGTLQNKVKGLAKNAGLSCRKR